MWQFTTYFKNNSVVLELFTSGFWGYLKKTKYNHSKLNLSPLQQIKPQLPSQCLKNYLKCLPLPKLEIDSAMKCEYVPHLKLLFGIQRLNWQCSTYYCLKDWIDKMIDGSLTHRFGNLSKINPPPPENWQSKSCNHNPGRLTTN